MILQDKDLQISTKETEKIKERVEIRQKHDLPRKLNEVTADIDKQTK